MTDKRFSALGEMTFLVGLVLAFNPAFIQNKQTQTSMTTTTTATSFLTTKI